MTKVNFELLKTVESHGGLIIVNTGLLVAF